MAAAYATAAELATWIGAAAPANADWLLARATELIDSIVTAPYAIDEVTELPTDSEEAEALRDATCAQVRFWQATGYEHDIDGLAGSDFAIGSLSGKRAPECAPQARRILKNARLL